MFLSIFLSLGTWVVSIVVIAINEHSYTIFLGAGEGGPHRYPLRKTANFTREM